MIRVLVAEDSPTARELLVAILETDPEIRVAGVAKNGAEAVEMTKELRPDLVTLDIQMPVMSGFEATKRIMMEQPTPIILISGNVDVREAERSVDALRLGALWVLRKPPGPGSPGFAESAREVVSMVRAMSQVKVVRQRAVAPVGRDRRPSRPARVVAFATSTGGPAALARIFLELPRDLAAPILVVQHMSRGFIQSLAGSLNAVSPFRVKVAEQGERLLPGLVYLAPDDCHLGVGQGLVHLSDDPPLEGFRPSGNYLFASVAAAFGPGAVAVILTGMGRDGVRGLRTLRDSGGYVLAQDEETSVVYGMPGAATEAGLVHEALPLGSIASRLGEIVRGKEQHSRGQDTRR